MTKSNDNVERLLVIGAITSDDFLDKIAPLYKEELIESVSARYLCNWCIQYYGRFNKAPYADIENIYFEKLQNGLDTDIAEGIEAILADLSEDFSSKEYNVQYLIESAENRLKLRQIDLLRQQLEVHLEKNDYASAFSLVQEFHLPASNEDAADLLFSETTSLDAVERAFATTSECLVQYPKQLGAFWNSQFIRGGFVAFLAPEKRGKSFLLMDIARRAVRQKRRVAFFQAGDMSEANQLRRFCINLTKKSDKEKYCAPHWQPVRDCMLNQLDECTERERQCSFGVFPGMTKEKIRKEITYTELEEAAATNPEYEPCWNCKRYTWDKIGAVWLQKVPKTDPLEVWEAKAAFKKHFIDTPAPLMLSTHANGTLSVNNIYQKLALWEKKQQFKPDVIIIDYADLLIADRHMDERAKQNDIWKALRKLSQEKNCLVITVTQADAASYETNTLRLKNFSEDKRKYAHVTAMYGLNQDKDGREKKLGILRINELILREDDFDINRFVYVLQNLRRGMPCITSYF